MFNYTRFSVFSLVICIYRYLFSHEKRRRCTQHLRLTCEPISVSYLPDLSRLARLVVGNVLLGLGGLEDLPHNAGADLVEVLARRREQGRAEEDLDAVQLERGQGVGPRAESQSVVHPLAGVVAAEDPAKGPEDLPLGEKGVGATAADLAEESDELPHSVVTAAQVQAQARGEPLPVEDFLLELDDLAAELRLAPLVRLVGHAQLVGRVLAVIAALALLAVQELPGVGQHLLRQAELLQELGHFGLELVDPLGAGHGGQAALAEGVGQVHPGGAALAVDDDHAVALVVLSVHVNVLR